MTSIDMAPGVLHAARDLEELWQDLPYLSASQASAVVAVEICGSLDLSCPVDRAVMRLIEEVARGEGRQPLIFEGTVRNNPLSGR